MTETAASVSDVDQLGHEWGFTLYGQGEDERMAFVFNTETEARSAHKMMQHITASAVAIAPAEEDRGLAPIVAEIAAMDPLFEAEHRTTLVCFYCCAEDPQSAEDHAPDCLWIRASRLQLTNPAAKEVEGFIAVPVRKA